jgi:hypothetical protein
VSRCCHLPRDLVGLEKERSHRNTVCRHNAGTILFLVSWLSGLAHGGCLGVGTAVKGFIVLLRHPQSME